MLKLTSRNRLRLRAFTTFTCTGEDSFISFAAAASKLRCNATATIHNSINPLSATAFSYITTFPRTFHSSSSEDDDDDYSELGPLLPKPLTNVRKLMTEKPEPYRKTTRTKKLSGVPPESSISFKDDSSKHESSKRASSAGEVFIKSFDLPIHPADDQEAVTIRITNINSETTDSALHSMCMSYGSLEGLVRTKEDAVDALFSAKGNQGVQSIITKLNQTVVNDQKWAASLHPKDSAPAQSIANWDLGMDISRHLGDLRRQMVLKSVCIEDLEHLHNALLHLEAHPYSSSIIPNND